MKTNQLIALLCFYITGLTGCRHCIYKNDIDESDQATINNLNKIDQLLIELKKKKITDEINQIVNNLNKKFELIKQIATNALSEEIIKWETINQVFAAFKAELKWADAHATNVLNGESKDNIRNLISRLIKTSHEVKQIIEELKWGQKARGKVSNDTIKRGNPSRQAKGQRREQKEQINNEIINTSSKIGSEVELYILKIIKADLTKGSAAISTKLSKKKSIYVASATIWRYLNKNGLQNEDERAKPKNHTRIDNRIQELEKILKTRAN